MIFCVFAFLAHIQEHKLLTTFHHGLNFVHIGLTHARFGVVDNLQKAGRMLMSHGPLLCE